MLVRNRIIGDGLYAADIEMQAWLHIKMSCRHKYPY